MILPRLISILILTASLWAHPMGNFSVNHYAFLEVSAHRVALTYALDLAEIPTFELLQQWKLDAKAPREALQAKAEEQAREWVRGLELRAADVRLKPRFLAAELVLADGAGGLAVARITARLELPPAPGKLEFEDRNYSERAGWKEIVIAAGEGATLVKTSHGSTDRSKALTEYPAEPTIAPPQDLRAALEWKLGGPSMVAGRPHATEAAPAAPQPASGTLAKGDFLSRILWNRELTLAMIAIGLLVAFGLGAMHALSPGHGKTIVAAYLVGSRGTAAHAAILGGMVTFTHTASVFALGLATLFLSEYFLPEKVYPVLGAISGLSIVLIGASLFWKRLRKLRAGAHHDHPHNHHHHHDHHHDHGHDHGPDGHTHYIESDVTLASLIALGASGGLVPCPSALVLLLSSIALGRVGLGLILLVAFSFGLATVLMGIGMLVLFAKHLLPDTHKAAGHPAFKLVPVLSAAVITIVGCMVTAVSLGWVQPSRWVN